MITLLDVMTEAPTLFDGITLPEGIDRETLVNQILFEGCTLYPIYQDPILLKRMIEHYFLMRYQIHYELSETLKYDYEPLENYDRTEDRTNNSSGTEGVTRDRSGSAESSGTTEEQVSAFNADTYQPQSKTISDASQSDSSNETMDRSHSDAAAEHVRIHGNIGVTTSQQMLESQRNVVQFSLYDFIAKHFIKKFMIGIY